MTATNQTTIGITGATGHIGGQVARLLAADLPADTRLRLLVRDASRAPDLPGAEVVEVQYGDPAAVEALTGVDVLLMVSAAESDDRVGEHRAFVEHAVEAGRRPPRLHLVRRRHPRLRLPARPRPRRHRGDHPRHRASPRRSCATTSTPRCSRSSPTTRECCAGRPAQGLVAPVSRRDVAEVAAAVLRAPADARRCDVRPDRAGGAHPRPDRGGPDRRHRPPAPLPRRDAGGGARQPRPLRGAGLDGRGLDQHLHRHPRRRAGGASATTSRGCSAGPRPRSATPSRRPDAAPTLRVASTSGSP